MEAPEQKPRALASHFTAPLLHMLVATSAAFAPASGPSTWNHLVPAPKLHVLPWRAAAAMSEPIEWVKMMVLVIVPPPACTHTHA